jgi:hypothetical protein
MHAAARSWEERTARGREKKNARMIIVERR